VFSIYSCAETSCILATSVVRIDWAAGDLTCTGPVMADTHHLGDAASVVSVGLHGTRRKEALGMAGFDANHGDTCLAEATMQPFRQWTGFDAGEINLTRPLRQARNEWPWFALYLAITPRRRDRRRTPPFC
jgi:hypothetical protein